MEIGKLVAAHHEFAYGTACLHHTNSFVEASFVTLDFVRKTALQGMLRVVQPLLRVAYAVEQLLTQRARATIDLALEIDDIRDNQFRGSTGGRRTQVCDKIATGKIAFVTHSRDDWHGGEEYCARDELFIELPQIFNAATAAGDHDEIDRRK